jgi:glucans biosynthesis protein C
MLGGGSPVDERRYYGLDALRGGMMMLGIVLHASLLYLAEPPPGYPLPTDRNTAFSFDVILVLIHSFRMPTFFVLAGFFTSLLVEKRGVGGTYANRAKRILAPLAVGIVTILPLTALLTADFMLSMRFGTRDLVPDPAAWKALVQEMKVKGISIDKPTLGHLWFLYFLCFFYLLIPLCRFLVRYCLQFKDQLQRWLVSPLLLLPLALFTAATLWPFHGGMLFMEYPSLKPHLPSLLYFASFYVLGYLFHHYPVFLPALARNVPYWALLALVVFPLAGTLTRLDIGARGGSVALHLGAVLTNGLCTWSLVYLFMGSALRFFDRKSAWILYVSQSAYWVFLVHLPLVFLAGWWLLQFNLPAALKFIIVCTFTSAVAFLTFHYWVRKTWLSNFLHGRRFDLDWPWRESGSAQQPPSV